MPLTLRTASDTICRAGHGLHLTQEVERLEQEVKGMEGRLSAMKEELMQARKRLEEFDMGLKRAVQFMGAN